MSAKDRWVVLGKALLAVGGVALATMIIIAVVLAMGAVRPV